VSDHISPDALLARIAMGTKPAILDVRTEREFADGHVPGATHVPFWQVSKRLGAIPASKEDELIVYCGTGPRAMIAGRSLRKHGFTRVVYLEGHFSRWRSGGFREERA
jgi:rhodanese-related sulfurtransferase